MNPSGNRDLVADDSRLVLSRLRSRRAGAYTPGNTLAALRRSDGRPYALDASATGDAGLP